MKFIFSFNFYSKTMEIKTEKNEIVDLNEVKQDPLKGTKYDTVFGSKSPLRKKGTTLNDWTNEDPDLKAYIDDIDLLKIPKFGFDNNDLESYFKSDEKSIDTKTYEAMKKLDILEKRYDIPEIAIILRKWDVHEIVIYLIEGENDDYITTEMRKGIRSKILCERIIKRDSIKLIKKFFESKFLANANWNNRQFEWLPAYAAQEGHLHILKWLRNPDTGGGVCPWDEYCCSWGARSGHLNVLKWLRDPDTGGGVCDWDWSCCIWAAKNGHDVLKWLRDPNTGGGVCPRNEWCCAYAAQGGHLNVLKWLRDPDTGGGVCPWDEWCCIWAAKNGHLHILKWLRDPDTGGGVCPRNEYCCGYAKGEISDWMKANNCPCGGTLH